MNRFFKNLEAMNNMLGISVQSSQTSISSSIYTMT